MDFLKCYKNLNVAITGGLGMLGSTIAHLLADSGANITLIDSMLEPYGGNLFNIYDIRDKVTVNFSDIRDKNSLKYLLKDKDIVFNLAAQVSYTESLYDPYTDLEINCLGHLNVLETLRNYNPSAKVIFSGSRLEYGKIHSNPVKENHQVVPESIYATHKYTAERYYQIYHDVHNIDTVCFRISNPYGPKQQMKHSRYGIVNWFIKSAMMGKKIKIFGTGEQVRDYIYVEDLAKALILAAINKNTAGEVYNVGSGYGVKFKDMVKTVVEVVGKGNYEFVEWPDDYKNIETGGFVADISKLQKCIDWEPSTDLRSGIKKTYEYYKKYYKWYWD